MSQAYEKLIKTAIQEKIFTEKEFKSLKRKIAKEFGKGLPRNEDLRKKYLALRKSGKIKLVPELERLLVTKKTRTLSGVSVIAVLTKDLPCLNNCLYCPTEKAMPKSYLSNEPAVMRAIRLDFDPYEQVNKRMAVLEYNGHDVSKLELIIMGGTFSHFPAKYQYWFALNCFKAANEYSLPKGKVPEFKNFSLKEFKNLLKKEKIKNKIAQNRIVGLTLETRPDQINLKELIKFRELGCTRVEIGVQSIYDEVLKKNKRGHGIKETIRATRLLKDMGFKINYHIMPGLWGSSYQKDLKMFQELFTNQDFQPDMLKIYPCVVTKEAALYQIWEQGKYQPYSNQELARLIVAVKKIVPPYVRITRLIRDIPTTSIEAGPNIPNLRGILKEEKVACVCVRCREIGRNVRTEEKPKLNIIKYKASEGEEYFLQYISGSDKLLHAFLRLRIPSLKVPVKELEGSAIIREVHSYGQVASIGQKINKISKHQETSQHQGFGKRLIKEAEKIVAKHNLKKIAVIAAEGTKEYYEKLGYKEGELYMSKNLMIKV